jgi:murein DD-endopeptidase MepM/ murein hydrolase activator NlpD
VRQGGSAVVYLTEVATAATLTFQGRQYPMLPDGTRWWAIIGAGAFTQPGLYPVSVAYAPAANAAVMTVTSSLSVTDYDFPVEYIQLDPTTAALLAPDIVQNELARRAAIFAGYTMQRLWSGAFVRPAQGALSGVYGEGRSYNGGPVTDYHKGTDFIGSTGAPVYAAARGRVAFTGELQVRGNAIMLDHGAGLFTAYHHLSAIEVTPGQTVNAGERIGAIGATGLVTGPHLHWEVILRGVEVDGEPWLQGAEIGP